MSACVFESTALVVVPLTCATWLDACLACSYESVPSRTVLVRDFSGPITHLKVHKNPGMEAVELLDSLSGDDGPGSKRDVRWHCCVDFLPCLCHSLAVWLCGCECVQASMWQRLGRLLGGDDGSDDEEGETIHVFSLASGHLYERFMKIMMLSVVRRSSSPVKFWLVENFLSPEFKDAIPHLAEKCVAAAVVCVRTWGAGSRARNARACRFGFEVQMVTYKWPNWLRQQTEKQRIIWGYKILFLDTLFPLNLKKVIYVDADQVVRGDLTELWNMDLKGKPYGYTPFCTSREVC